MKTIVPLILCLAFFFYSGSGIMAPAMALEKEANPVINLTVKDKPLADVLDTISQQTGYRFTLEPKWQSHPVSATIVDLPLEKGLKRLLKSLNHTIVWESDNTIVIKVFGKSETGRSSNAISFSEPPQSEPYDTSIDEQEEEGGRERNELHDQGDDQGETMDLEEEPNMNAADPDESE